MTIVSQPLLIRLLLIDFVGKRCLYEIKGRKVILPVPSHRQDRADPSLPGRFGGCAAVPAAGAGTANGAIPSMQYDFRAPILGFADTVRRRNKLLRLADANRGDFIRRDAVSNELLSDGIRPAFR